VSESLLKTGCGNYGTQLLKHCLLPPAITIAWKKESSLSFVVALAFAAKKLGFHFLPFFTLLLKVFEPFHRISFTFSTILIPLWFNFHTNISSVFFQLKKSFFFKLF
jgi:hypothetical protein